MIKRKEKISFVDKMDDETSFTNFPHKPCYNFSVNDKSFPFSYTSGSSFILYTILDKNFDKSFLIMKI